MGEYVQHFSPADAQVGAVFAINGKVVGLDSFGNAECFAKVFKKLLESYALDALDWYDPEQEKKVSSRELSRFLEDCLAAATETHRGVGLGTDHRIESEKTTGFALMLDDRLLHLCIFAKPKAEETRSPSGGMRRFSGRRNNRL
jgi:hypothetical protein